MIIPFNLEYSNIELASITKEMDNYYPNYIPDKLVGIENNNIEIVHYNHINNNIYSNTINYITINNNIGIYLLNDILYSFSILIKTNNCYIDSNQWNISFQIQSIKNDMILYSSDSYKIPYYQNDNNNNMGWYKIIWFFKLNKLDEKELFKLVLLSIGLDKCMVSNDKICYSICKPELNIYHSQKNLFPYPDLRIGWDEYSINDYYSKIEETNIKWNNIIDWNIQNIPYPETINYKNIDLPIIKFQFNNAYINNDNIEEKKIYQSYWLCEKNNIILEPNTVYRFTMFVKTTPIGNIEQQKNALYSDKLYIDNMDYSTKSIFMIIYLGHRRGKLKSEKIEIIPYISGSLQPPIDVVDKENNKVKNNGWVECVWEFNSGQETTTSINFYLFTYNLRKSNIYFYNPILLPKLYKPIDNTINISLKKMSHRDKKIIILYDLEDESNNTMTILHHLLEEIYNYSNISKISMSDNIIKDIEDLLEYNYKKLVIFYFSNNHHFFSKTMIEIFNKINVFIILNNIPIPEYTKDNIIFIGLQERKPDYNIIENMITILKNNNYYISILDMMEELDTNIVTISSTKINKYDIFSMGNNPIISNIL